MEGNYTIFAATIIGRIDYVERHRDLNFLVSDSDVVPSISQKANCGSFEGQVPSYLTIHCPQWTIGRYFSILKTNASDTSSLTLCEIDIFEYELNKSKETFFLIIQQFDYSA